MRNFNDKIIITMPDLMEQMDISDKTIHRMIEEGELPDFTYGSKNSKKKGWHSAILERHAIQEYEKSQSIQTARHIGQVGTKDMGITLFCGCNGSMTQNLTDLENGNSFQQKLCRKKMS